MKKIFTADIHLHEFSMDNVLTESGITLKLQELLNAFKQMCDYAMNNNIEEIIIGGDINHKKNVVYARSFIRFKKVLKQYPNLKFIIIPGNHDIVDMAAEESAVELLDGLKNVDIIMNVEQRDNILYIPHSNELFNNIKKSEPTDILISHLPLSEGKVDSGLSINTAFSKKDLKKFKLVLLGDYHTYQNIDNIYYPGTLIPNKRNELGDKGFIVFDSDNLDVEFVETTGYRKCYNLELTEDVDVKDFIKNIKTLNESGHYITINKKIKEIPQSLKNVMENNVSINDNFEGEIISRGISANQNLDDQFKKYLEIEEIEEYNHKKYLEVVKDALHKR